MKVPLIILTLGGMETNTMQKTPSLLYLFARKTMAQVAKTIMLHFTSGITLYCCFYLSSRVFLLVELKNNIAQLLFSIMVHQICNFPWYSTPHLFKCF